MLGLDLKVTINGLIDLSNDIEENLYIIIQEAMNNVIKHAKTNKVYLDLSQNVEYLEIDIRYNGQGFDTQSINTFLFNGLKNIKQRTQY
ncbi:ATP-binding protein, partial [Staphylococcus caprae]|uniref:sensor histidine kinase n=1 Tax=Staphylococcus caprae TaxID=29380 RepID=UPI0030BB3560